MTQLEICCSIVARAAELLAVNPGHTITRVIAEATSERTEGDYGEQAGMAALQLARAFAEMHSIRAIETSRVQARRAAGILG